MRKMLGFDKPTAFQPPRFFRRRRNPPNTGPLPCSWTKPNQRKVRKNFRRAIAAGY